MRLTAVLSWLLPAIAMAAPTAGERCGGLETRPLAKETMPLLGGRLRVQPLAGTHPPPRLDVTPVGASSLEVGTRGKKLTVSARELFQRAGPDFAARARASAAPGDRVESFAAAGLSGVVMVPQTLTRLDVDGEVLRALRVLVASPDGTVQEIQIEVNRAAARDGAGCSALGRRIVATLAAGDGKLDLDGGPRELRELRARLARDQAMVGLRGPDFDVFTVHHMVPFPQRATLGVYLGHHPHRPAEAGARRVPGRMFGKPVEFLESSHEGLVSRQALAEVPGIDRLMVHLFYEADDPEILRALQRTAETLTVR